MSSTLLESSLVPPSRPRRSTLADAASAPPLQFVSELPSYKSLVRDLRVLLASASEGSSPLSATSAVPSESSPRIVLSRQRLQHLAWTGSHSATLRLVDWIRQNAPGASVPDLLQRLGSGDSDSDSDSGGGSSSDDQRIRLGDFFEALQAELNLCRVWNRLAPGATMRPGALRQHLSAGTPTLGEAAADEGVESSATLMVQLSAFIVLLKQPEVKQERQIIEEIAGAGAELPRSQVPVCAMCVQLHIGASR